jgi:hypothetical protein
MMKRWSFIAFAAILISGCSQTVETRISNMGSSALSPVPFFMTPDAKAAPELRTAYTAVSDALTTRGYKAADTGPLYLQVTLASRPADLSLGTAKGPASLSGAKSKKPLQSCNDHEYRIGVTLTQVADGTVAYQGNAAEYHCNMPLAEAVPALVKAALADIGRPRGIYTVKRSAKD